MIWKCLYLATVLNLALDENVSTAFASYWKFLFHMYKIEIYLLEMWNAHEHDDDIFIF